ncbi:hypothetical protein [Azospirillum sp.]|uniref:hypothetical protein n=1 Tax=Azospirillum sp. TaxID=34012 RepID=UPI002D638A18|nr:hypothetical protein [Azospirillum sp.]HYD70508.1 hypothetical protein [Azospirillum sp.]
MATDSISSAPSAGSMLSSVGSLQNSINAAISSVTKDKGTDQAAKAPEVQEFRKDVRKSPFNTPGAATDIGILVKNKSRLNAVSSLAAKDAADFYKFKAVNRGDLSLGQVGDEGLRVQVMTRTGVVIADSNEDAGSLNDAYKKMKDGAYEVSPGDYVLRVSRQKGVDDKKGLNYALQVRMGNYTQDFDTVAKAPRPGDGLPNSSAAQQGLQDMLNTSVNTINNLDPIGTSATQKLQNAMGGGSIFGVRNLGSIKGGRVNLLS